MTEEALQLSRAAAESERAPPGLLAQVADRLRLGVQHLLFDDPVALLFGVQLRRVGWQPLEVVVGRVSGHEGLHRVRPMRMESVPGDNHRTADLLPEIPQRADYLRAMDRPGEMAGVEARGTGQRRHQGDDARDLPPLAHSPQNWRGAPRGPRSGATGATIRDIPRRWLTRRRIGGCPRGAQVVPTRPRNVCPAPSHNVFARI